MDQESAVDQSAEKENVAPESMEIPEVDPTASNIVKNHIIASLTLGLVPVPLFDLAALTATQMSMLRSLGEYYDLEFDNSDHKALLTSLIGGSLPVMGVLGLSSFTKLIPGVGSLVGSASLSLSAGAVTYAVGQVFIMHFESGGTFEDFDPKVAREYFKREFSNGKTFVSEMREELKVAKEQKEEASANTKGEV